MLEIDHTAGERGKTEAIEVGAFEKNGIPFPEQVAELPLLIFFREKHPHSSASHIHRSDKFLTAVRLREADGRRGGRKGNPQRPPLLGMVGFMGKV
jgi:hypothetical protein